MKRSLMLVLFAGACSSSSPAAPDSAPAPVLPDAPASIDATVDAPACSPPAARAAAERVATTSGLVHGAAAGTLYTYFNIPFAAPPVGALRFAPPAAPTCAPAEIDATTLGPECAQLDTTGAVAGVEDCLQLNVWAPAAAAAPRPVMVFIHGGANAVGSAGDPLYDGTNLATTGDTIVVTINYRLGQLGFIALPALATEGPGSGVYGLLDQIAALHWVHDNIAAFGGDPTNVTIFGESAGGRDVCSLVASPSAAGLFARSVIESGSCGGLPTKTAAEATGTSWATAAGCTTGDIAACVRALPLATALQTLPPDPSILVSTLYQPAIDGVVQPVQPVAAITAGTHNHGAFLIGANADETGKEITTQQIPNAAAYQAALVSQFGSTVAAQVLAQYPVASYATARDAYVAVTTDSRFVCPSRQFARAALAGQTQAVYRYFFAYSTNPLGAVHGIELPFLFGTFSAVTSTPPGATSLAVSTAIQTDWLSFARGGAPTGTPAWPVYAANDPTREYDATPSVVDGIRTANCDFWMQIE